MNIPAWLERVSYACSGSPTLAADVVAALKAAGHGAVVDLAQGLDFAYVDAVVADVLRAAKCPSCKSRCRPAEVPKT